ncbi:MAG: 30S ribosomal protein S13 [Parachlamydiales bacterium]|nr:30S ribosomal protein S13 [Parachlamydiales bacterium]
MPRIIGVDIPDNKRLEIALTYIYGIGRKVSNDILHRLHLDPNLRAKKLTEEQIAQISDLIQKEYIVEGDLRREIQNNIKRLQAINTYRGTRHRKGLPARGQRTSSNARTRKGKKRQPVAIKKAVLKK